MEAIGRIFKPPAASLFLFRPRGPGKSFWLKAQLPQALWIHLLDPPALRTLLAKPERLRELVGLSDSSGLVLVDIKAGFMLNWGRRRTSSFRLCAWMQSRSGLSI
jgi:hypothetical protein